MTENPYETSAEVSKITGRNKGREGDIFYYYGKDDFLFEHERFDHPNIILNDNISLYSITTEEAVFVDCGGYDVFSDEVTFVYFSQFQNSLKIITLPIKSFHLIASQIQIPKAPILHIANHSRSGSTLTYRIFQSIPKTFSISEPYALGTLAECSLKDGVTKEELQKICISIIKCYTKHANVRESELICIKSRNICIFITNVIFEVWPAIKHIYLYRHPISFIRSWEKLHIVNKWPEYDTEQLKKICVIGKNNILSGYPLYTDDYLGRLGVFGKWALHWITCSAAYNSILRKGHPIASMKYEGFFDHPEEMILNLFKYFEIPLEKLPNVNEILKIDSQLGTKYSTKNAVQAELKKKLIPITDAIKDEVNEMCEDFNLPSFWDTDVSLENDIDRNFEKSKNLTHC